MLPRRDPYWGCEWEQCLISLIVTQRLCNNDIFSVAFSTQKNIIRKSMQNNLSDTNINKTLHNRVCLFVYLSSLR